VSPRVTGAIVRLSLAALTAFALAAPARARTEETSWSVQLLVGVPFNFPARVKIRQEGAPDLRFRGRFATHPFESPWYYGVGAFRRSGGREWSAELVHHKVFLENPPPEVQAFSISHGYNLLLAGLGVEVAPGVWARGAAGAVIAHPESTVRGRTLPDRGGIRGYHLAGPALSVGLEGRVPMGERLRIALGGRMTAAQATVPVEGGSARVPNVAFHATAGLAGDLVR